MTRFKSGSSFARSFALLALAALACPALAQVAAPRTLVELKAEVQERANRHAYPVSELDPAGGAGRRARIHARARLHRDAPRARREARRRLRRLLGRALGRAPRLPR